MADYDLDYLLAQVRRIEEHREAGAETKIRRTYQKILKELRHYLADTYSQYAEDDKLTYDILQRHGRYARFLDEVEKKINDLSPETKRLIRSVVEQTYEHTYNGMIEAVKNTANDVVSGLKGCTPAILRRAVENPVSKLTLNDRLEKHRKEIIYDIKQAITVGLVNGDRYSTMANRIKQSVDGSYKKAIRISRTETHRVREAGNLDAAESVQTALNTGNVPLQMMKVWKTMKDERVRPAKQKGRNKQYDHRKMDGVVVKIDEMFTLPSGAKTMAPGQSGVAGEDINCRCYLSYKLDAESKQVPNKDKQKKQEEAVENTMDSDIMKSDLGKFKNKLKNDTAVNKEYYSCLKDKFAHGSDDAKRLFIKYADDRSVENASYEGVAHFNASTKKISMHYGADLRNPRGAGVTYFHEHGHLIDDALGKISADEKYKALLKEDAFSYRKAYGKIHNLKTFSKVDEAISKELNDMRRHSAISDLMQGVTDGNIVGIAVHPAGYWNKEDNITAEAFAHMFEAQFDKTRRDEMQKYFPKSLAYFEKMIKEAGK